MLSVFAVSVAGGVVSIYIVRLLDWFIGNKKK